MSAGRSIWTAGWRNIMGWAGAAPNQPAARPGRWPMPKSTAPARGRWRGNMRSSAIRNSAPRYGRNSEICRFLACYFYFEAGMIFEQIVTGGCQSYLVGCEDSRAAILIDPHLQQ